MNITNSFPINSFYFNVEINGDEIPFQSVSGLGVEHQLKDRTGTQENYNVLYKEIVNVTYPNIVLKKGIFVDDPKSWKDRRANTLSQDEDLEEKLNKIRIEEMFISLAVDGNFKNAGENLALGRFGDALENFTSQGVVLNWTLYNLVPQKWQISTLDSMNNEFLTETVEFAYEKLMLNY